MPPSGDMRENGADASEAGAEASVGPVSCGAGSASTATGVAAELAGGSCTVCGSGSTAGRSLQPKRVYPASAATVCSVPRRREMIMARAASHDRVLRTALLVHIGSPLTYAELGMFRGLCYVAVIDGF